MPMPRASHGTNRRYTQWECRCEECVQAHAAWLDENRSKQRERTRAWRAANPERLATQRAKFRNEHRAELRVKNLAYYHARMESDPEAIRKNRREWAKTPQGVIANRLARHARRGAPLDREYAEILYRDPCCMCGERPVEIDHITPIDAGGLGDWTNLAPLCRACNAKKSNRTLLASMI